MTIIIGLLIGIALMAVRARPYDYGGLRELLMPPGCPIPCVIGIRPGVTPRAEALELLRAHPDVLFVTETVSGGAWRWRHDHSIARMGGMVTIESINTRTRATFADVYLLFGAPDNVWLNRQPDRLSFFIEVQAAYRDQPYRFSIDTCPATRELFWQQPVNVLALSLNNRMAVQSSLEPVLAFCARR